MQKLQTMKHIISILVLSVLGIALLPGCTKKFLDRPPLGAPTSGTFYQTDQQILDGTGPLYDGSWGGYNGTPLQYIGDIMGGNSTTDNYQSRGAYINFSVSSTDPSGALQSSYQALWSVIANANVVAYNIKNAGAGASAGAKTEGLAECYFMRAAAYYYLTLIWGAVPIVYDNIHQLSDTSTPRAPLLDDWQFQINDLTWAAQNLPATSILPARVNKWSAEGMLGRAYLVRSGLTGSGGQRNAADLDSAVKYLTDVAVNSGATLDPSYYDLFTSGSFAGTKVPSECLFALLWIPQGQYYIQNHMQANLAYSPLITQTGDGWGAAFGGSPSLMDYYFNVEPNDTLRRRATVFMPNSFYPDINKIGGGWLVDSTLFNNAQITAAGQPGNGYGSDHAFVKKYVIGSPADNGNLGGTQSENLNTYIFRLDDVYLLLAEAILGNNANTTDPTALTYFNMVRERAGLKDKTVITYSDLVQEKKAEFAFEGHAWYDWKEWYYFDPTDAIAYFSNQNRGNYNITYNGGNSFITFFGSNGLPGTVMNPITAQTADLPYPESELLVSPALSKAPVQFDFTKVLYN
jgi:starch-binding outer membrane protein, SusD/RagB family